MGLMGFNQDLLWFNQMVYMGVSENVEKTPINPMVLLIIIPFLNGYFIGKINPIFRQTHIYHLVMTNIAMERSTILNR